MENNIGIKIISVWKGKILARKKVILCIKILLGIIFTIILFHRNIE
jgi:hypothetical protein